MESFFINLCGHYSVGRKDVAARWDDKSHKAMWYFVHELKATTNQEWVVVDENSNMISEDEDARTFDIYLVNTIENLERTAIVEEQTFNERFNGDKPTPNRVYYSELRINGRIKYLPVAEVNGKYYRYKCCLPAMDMTERMWRW